MSLFTRSYTFSLICLFSCCLSRFTLSLTVLIVSLCSICSIFFAVLSSLSLSHTLSVRISDLWEQFDRRYWDTKLYNKAIDEVKRYRKEHIRLTKNVYFFFAHALIVRNVRIAHKSKPSVRFNLIPVKRIFHNKRAPTNSCGIESLKQEERMRNQKFRKAYVWQKIEETAAEDAPQKYVCNGSS